MKATNVVHGVALPIITLVIDMLALMHLPSAAKAAEFAALAILLILLAALLITLIGPLLRLKELEQSAVCYRRGLRIPGLFLLAYFSSLRSSTQSACGAF